MQQRLVAV